MTPKKVADEMIFWSYLACPMYWVRQTRNVVGLALEIVGVYSEL